MRKLLFLDMDGVIADFNGAIHKAHGRENIYLDQNNWGKWDIEQVWGISPKEFWALDSREFWESVQPTPEAHEIVSLAQQYFDPQDIAILTAPSNDPGCVPGKFSWMQRTFPQFANRMIFTKPGAKKFMGGPGRFLIDDKDSNVDQFEEAGGTGILVPRHWNSQSHKADLVLSELAMALELSK